MIYNFKKYFDKFQELNKNYLILIKSKPYAEN